MGSTGPDGVHRGATRPRTQTGRGVRVHPPPLGGGPWTPRSVPSSNPPSVSDTTRRCSGTRVGPAPRSALLCHGRHASGLVRPSGRVGFLEAKGTQRRTLETHSYGPLTAEGAPVRLARVLTTPELLVRAPHQPRSEPSRGCCRRPFIVQAVPRTTQSCVRVPLVLKLITQ